MSDADTANAFGYSLAFFDQNPELKGLLGQATSGNWTADRFVAALRNTKWFQTTSESQRKYLALKTGDPATLTSMLASAQAKISTMASQLGAKLSASNIASLADQYVRLGWDDNMLKRTVGAPQYITPLAANGLYSGEAGVSQTQIKQLAADYGVPVADSAMGSWVRNIALGNMTTDNVRAILQQQATSKYPPFAERLNAGETMRQIADPYIQTQAKLLELNPEQINIGDPSIQQALVTKDAKGQPVAKSVWQYEQDLRQDARWLKTDNAQQSFMSTAHDVLKSFGMLS